VHTLNAGKLPCPVFLRTILLRDGLACQRTIISTCSSRSSISFGLVAFVCETDLRGISLAITKAQPRICDVSQVYATLTDFIAFGFGINE